jgi:hypothetical protein
MAWSDSLSKNFKLKKTEEQKKQTSDKEQKQNSQSGNFYEDFKARKANNTKENVTERLTGSASFNKNNTNKSTDRAYTNKSESIVKKTSPTSTFVNNSNRFKGYRTYSERKKTGNIFVPSTVLGKYTNGFSKENTEKMKSNKWKGSYGVMPVQEKITSGDTATKEKKPGFGKWLGDNVMNGIGQFNRSVASTADLIIPTAGDFGGDSIVDRVIDYYKGDSDRLAQNAEKTNAIKGGNWGTAGKLVSGTVSALPNAIIAMMSGGTSTGAAALESTASKGIGETMLSSAKQLMKNPMYWSSFVQTAGNSFDEAKADGASDIEATATAMISSFLNAGVEVGGGIETIPSNPRSIKTWVKGMFDEGKEEVVQGIIEQATKKAVYDHNKKIVSKTDQNAIINPSRSADEFVGGAVVGGILGAGQMGAGAALDAYGHTVQTGREFKDMGEVQSVIDTGNKSDRNTSAYKYAQKMQQKQDKGVDLSDWNIGRQYQKNVKAIDAENKFINDISGATGVETEVHADMHGLNGRYISSVNNKYSPIEYDGNGNAYVRIDEDILEGVAPEDYIKTVRNVLKYKFSDGINLNGKNIAVSGKSRGEFTSSKYTKNMSASDRADKFRMANNIDEIVNVQNNINTEGLKHPRKDDIISFDGGYATIKVGNNEFLGKILLANKQDGTQQFYDIVDLIPTKIQQPHFNAGRTNAIATDRNDGAVSTNSISENSKNVNGKIDISANGDTSIPTTVKHEFTHAFKQSAPQAYQDFEDYVMKSVMETNPEAVRKRLNSLKSRYEQEGIPYNDEIGREEIVAEMTSTFEPNVNKIAYGNPNLADKILQGISTAKAKIQSALSSPYTNDRTGVQMTYTQLNEAEQLWNNALRQAAENRGNANGGKAVVRNSITEIVGNNGNYGKGVYLDTDLFKGIKPRNWGKVLSKYVYDNLAGTELTVYDNNGNPETISFAKKNERVTKDDAVNSHKVIDKLARTRGNANSLGIVHIDELLQTATDIGSTYVNNHQWLDKNGWQYKKAYMQDINGRIYETTLNIAKTADGRNILYALSNTKQIDEGVVPSTQNGRGSHTIRLSVTDSIPENSKNVNGKIDISANGDTSIPTTVKHEFTHAFKQSAPQAYQDFEDYVMKSVMETNPEAVRKRLNSLKSRYEQEGIPYNDEIGREEIVAEMTSTFEPNVNKIAYGNPNLADKILQGISTAKAKIQSALSSPYTNDRTGVQMTYTQLNEAEQLWNNALRQAAENRGNVSSGEDAVRYSTVGNKNNSLKEQIRNNLEELDRMLPVMNYTYNINQNLSNSEKRNAVLDEYLRKYGTDNKNIIVTRKGFGDVSVGAKDIRSGLRYLNTDAEYAAVLAIPSVITEGTEIDRHNNHKNRGYNTITFAAPVEINGVRGNMAVTIKETNKYKYKMHRILLPDGSMFEFLDNEKNSSYNDGTVDDNVNGSPSIATVSNNSISENKPIVKNSLGGNTSDTQVKSATDNVGTFDKNKTDIRYSFAGDNAKTADMGALQQARDLEQSGVSIEEIRKTTGWSRGLDNKWKFEIDDSGAKYNEEKIRLGKSVNLDEVLEHNDLFKAYPDLKNVKVKEISGLEAKGIYSPEFDCIFMNKNMTTQEKLKSLIHEVQHAIQVREGFAVGESPDSENRNQSAGEIEADDVKARQGMSKEERLNTFPESMKSNPNADVVFWDNGNIKNMGDVNNQTNGNSNIYDYTKSFAEQINDWKQGLIPQNDSLLVSGTPEVLKKTGFNALPITINQKHIDYAINGTKDVDHHLGETLLKQLPQALENPVAIISSQTQPNRVVAILKMQHNGKNVVTPVEIDGYGTQNNLTIDSNAVVSIFGKDNAITKQLKNALIDEANNKTSMFYWNKKEALSLLQRPGLRLPNPLPQDGFIHNITEKNSSVKPKIKNATYSQQFKRWFGDWENNPKKASKVVNEDRTPKVVYHGTSNGGFWFFDTYGSNFGLFGNGSYFTESENVAKSYTNKGKGNNKQVYSVYLDIKKPIDMDAQADISKWNKAFKEQDIDVVAQKGDTNEQVYRKLIEELKYEDYSKYEAEEIVSSIIQHNMGYDGITHIGGGRFYGGSEKHRVWIAFEPEQVKSATDNVGTFDKNKADIRYSMKENTDTDKVSQLYEKTMQKNAYTDEFKDEAERRKPEFMYMGITNKETYEVAQTDISSRGDNTVLSELSMKNGEWSADDTAKSLALMAKYQSENNTSKAVDVASMLREKMTKAGQAVQALKIVNKLTPEGQFIDFVRQAEKAVDDQINKHPAKDKIRRELKEVENIDRQRGDSGEHTQNRNDKSEKDKVLDKWKIDHLDTDDTKQVNDVLKTLDTLNDKNDLINLILKQSKERKTASNVFVKKALEGQNIEFLKDTAVMQVFGKISDKIPSSIAQKASTYQAMSHLLNARTMMRNITSNAAFNTVDRISTDIGAIADSIIGLFSGQRTVGVDRGIFEKGRFKASADRAVAQYIDIALAVNHETDSSKYNLNSARRTFKSRTLGGLERGMSYGLQVTDEWSKGGIEYNIKKSLERLKKCGFTEDEIDNIAKFEAKYRTFQDDTKLSQILKGLKDTLNVIGIGETNQVGRLKSHEFGLGDLVQKYTQVPGALITRSVEYSPLGYCKALYNIGNATYNKSKGADFNATDQRNIALSLGRAMTGTGLIALFAGLSKLGIFTGERENEDDKLKAMENSEGISNTQLNLSALSRLIASGGKDTSGRKNGDILTSLGFLEPLNTLMAMGNAVAENGSVKNPVDWANAATAKTFDQIMDMSTMSTMRSISNTLTYGGNGLDVAIGTLADSGSGFVPSPVRQFGSFIDTTQRNPYNEENSIDKARERFRTSIPGMRNNVAAKVNSFGEEKTTSSGNRAIDFLNNFFSPGYVNVYQTNDISEELYRLSEQSADVLPHIPAKSFTVDKVQYKPRGKDYEVYSKLVGTITARKMHDIINADSYKDLSDEDKIIALSKAASDGEKEAKERYATRDKPAIQSENSVFRLTEPTTLNARKQALKESQEKQQRAVSYIQDVTDKLAEMLPDKADEYGVNSLQINDIKSIKVDGKSYDISSETEKKIVNTANEEHYSNVEKLMNNEINVEDIVGYTSKGKARTSTQADGSKVSLTGKMYNDDGTPRFDELVTVKIIYKSKENAKEHATEKYRDEIIGNNISADDEKSTKVSKSKRARTKFTSAKGSGHSSSEGKKKGRGKDSNNSGGTSRTRFTARANTNSTADKNNSNTQDILSLPNTVNPQLIQSAANSFMKNNNVSNTVKPIENPLFM